MADVVTRAGLLLVGVGVFGVLLLGGALVAGLAEALDRREARAEARAKRAAERARLREQTWELVNPRRVW